MSEYVLHFDGSCGPTNPGPFAGYGYVISKDGFIKENESGPLVGQTFSNNYAEFYALFKGLDYLLTILQPSDKLFIRGDSALVINIMRGKWRPKDSGIYFPAYLLASNALTCIRRDRVHVSIDWVPREMNTQADALSTSYRT
jgi:ribonuclease HI